ncbi:MAG: zinc ribbon domain-containing protein [Thermoleophilia bacterium]
MQRIFRRRASGSPRRGAGGLLGRLPSGLLRRRSGSDRLPWGRKAAATVPPGLEQQQTQDTQVIVQQVPGDAAGAGTSFRDRGRLRRRLRFLRRARELAFRDIGGLMFDMRRFGRERPDLVEAKINALAAVDQELRALERILDDRRPLHELREPGITSCARCGALHASDSNFCPNCGLQVGGPRAMGEVGGAIAAPPQPPLEPVHQPAAPGAVAPPPAAPVAPAAPAHQPPADPPAQQPPARSVPSAAPSPQNRPASSPTSQPTETMTPPHGPDERA